MLTLSIVLSSFRGCKFPSFITDFLFWEFLLGSVSSVICGVSLKQYSYCLADFCFVSCLFLIWFYLFCFVLLFFFFFFDREQTYFVWPKFPSNSGLPPSLAPCLECMEQKENPRNTKNTSSSKVLSQPAFFSPPSSVILYWFYK